MDAIVHFLSYDMPLWGILVLLAAVLIYWYLTKDFNMFDKYGITGPKPFPIIGTAWNTYKKGLFMADVELCREYRKKRIVRIFEMGLPGVMITDPHLAKAILVKEFAHFVNRKDQGSLMAPLDRSLITIRDDHWRHVRNSVSPTFSGAKLKLMMPLIQNCADSLIDVLQKKAEANEAVDAATVFRYFTIDVIASTMFGLNVDSLHDPNHVFVAHAQNLIRPSDFKLKVLIFFYYIKFFTVFVCPGFTKWLSKHGLQMGSSHIRYFAESMERALKERREEKEVACTYNLVKRAHKFSVKKYHDFLAIMTEHEVESSRATQGASNGMKWTNEGLTKDDIVAQMLIFFFAGFDTTTNTMIFAAYNMCLYGDMQRRLQDEVDEMLEGEEPNYDSVKKLIYLDMFLNETLRLFGPGLRLLREADKDIEIDGVTIPQGVAVWLPLDAYHRDPEIYPDPDTFNPERFSLEQKGKRDPSLFMPFGQGPRNCVGKRLALLEIKIGMAKILQNCTLTLDAETPTEIQMDKFSARPEKPLNFKVAMRSS